VRFLLIFALLAAVFWVYSVVDCAVQPSIRHRGVRKGVWILIVLVFPVVGGVLWFAVGRTRANAPLHAPDDDPAFLSTLGPDGRRMHRGPDRTTARDRAEQEQRIRELEEELSRLDGDSDDPDTTGPGGRGVR